VTIQEFPENLAGPAEGDAIGMRSWVTFTDLALYHQIVLAFSSPREY